MDKSFITAQEAFDYLIQVGQADDKEIDLIESSFAFALLDRPDADIKVARNHIKAMRQDLAESFESLAAQDNSDDITVQAKSLALVMTNKYGYVGDESRFGDIGNINMFSVIDRRMGLPVSLCILAIGLARGQGWKADGVNFPGHFIMRLEQEGERILIDPYQGCTVLEAKDLRQILKKIIGKDAELSADYYKPCSNREILLRYQNNLKYRLIDSEHYSEAMDIVKRMEIIAPQDFRLSLDKAVLYARLDQPRAAIDALFIYLDHVSDLKDKAEAQAFLYELQRQLN